MIKFSSIPKTPFLHSIRTRMMLTVLVLILLPMGIVTFTGMRTFIDNLEQDQKKASHLALVHTKKLLTRKIQQARQFGQFIAGFKEIRNGLSESNLNDLTAICRSMWPNVIVEIFDQEKKLILRNYIHDLNSENYFTLSTDTHLSDTLNFKTYADIYSLPKGIAIKSFTPILDFASLDIKGAVVITIPVDIWFLQSIKKVVQADITFLGKQNYFISTFHDNEGEPVTTAWPGLLKIQKNSQISKNIQSQKENIWGTLYGISYVPIFNMSGERLGILSSAININHIEQQKAQTIHFLFINAFFAFSSTILIGLIFSLNFTRPVFKLLTAIKDIGRGKMNTRVNIKRHDEFGLLGQAFNTMADKLQKHEEQLNSYSQQLASTNKQLKELNEHLEQMVAWRTAELANANEQLRKEIESRTKTEKELVAAIEKADAANKAKTEFLACVSHEIRTPLNAIQGMAELLMETDLNMEQRKYVQIFQSSGENLLKIINDIIDLSKIEAEKIIIETTDFDLIELIETTCDLMAPSAHEKKLELNFSIDPRLPNNFRGDPVRLRQILLNLIGNAIKFTEHGEILVQCKLEAEDCQSDSSPSPRSGCKQILLSFSVQDTGIGISSKYLEHIFEYFSQADASITRKYGGTGLGLTISKQLVELMGGQIWIDSQENRGTNVHFTICLEIDPSRNESHAITSDILKKHRVLIIEDNATAARLLQETLQKWHAKVDMAEEQKKARELLKKSLTKDSIYKFIFLDWHIFDKNTFKDILDYRLATNCFLVVLLTTKKQVEEMHRVREAGADAILIKPIKETRVFQTIEDLLHGQSTQPPQKIEHKEKSNPYPLPPMRILLAEDYTHNRLLIKSFLKDTNCQIDLANNGAEAIEKFKTNNYDLILMDIQMPVMDGYTATQKIRQIESKEARRPIPIIALTAHALKEDIPKSMDAGCSDHLSKPVKKEKLLQVIKKNISPEKQDSSPPDQHSKTNSLTLDSHSELPIDRNDLNKTEYTQQKVPQPFPCDDKNHVVHADSVFQDIIPIFMQDLENDLKNMREALQNKNYVFIEKISHNIKGVSGGYGFDELSKMAALLEEMAKEKKPTAIKETLNKISHYLKHVKVNYSK